MIKDRGERSIRSELLLTLLSWHRNCGVSKDASRVTPVACLPSNTAFHLFNVIAVAPFSHLGPSNLYGEMLLFSANHFFDYPSYPSCYIAEQEYEEE
jgi:hypothetical protein